MKRFTFIDLFAGCGGLSEGFYQENFKAVAHIEINSICCKTLIERMKFYNYKNAEDAVINEDITNKNIIKYSIRLVLALVTLFILFLASKISKKKNIKKRKSINTNKRRR